MLNIVSLVVLGVFSLLCQYIPIHFLCVPLGFFNICPGKIHGSARWFSLEDCGSQLMVCWAAKSYFTDLSLMLPDTKSHPYSDDCNSAGQDLNAVFKLHGGNGTLTASYLYHDERLKRTDNPRESISDITRDPKPS